MDELVERIARKTGLPEDQARAAATEVIDFLEERVPEPARGMIDQAIGSGSTDQQDIARQATDTAEGFFNRGS